VGSHTVHIIGRSKGPLPSPQKPRSQHTENRQHLENRLRRIAIPRKAISDQLRPHGPPANSRMNRRFGHHMSPRTLLARALKRSTTGVCRLDMPHWCWISSKRGVSDCLQMEKSGRECLAHVKDRGRKMRSPITSLRQLAIEQLMERGYSVTFRRETGS